MKPRLYDTLNIELDCTFSNVTDIIQVLEQAREFMKKHNIPQTILVYKSERINIYL